MGSSFSYIEEICDCYHLTLRVNTSQLFGGVGLGWAWLFLCHAVTVFCSLFCMCYSSWLLSPQLPGSTFGVKQTSSFSLARHEEAVGSQDGDQSCPHSLLRIACIAHTVLQGRRAGLGIRTATSWESPSLLWALVSLVLKMMSRVSRSLKARWPCFSDSVFSRAESTWWF